MMTYIGSNMNRFLETNIINSDKFASASDLIYSQRIGNKLFKNSPNKKIINISNDENFSCTVYKLINFELSENDVIFCNTDYLDNLFFHLNKINELKNLKLVTNQTDQLITKKVFDRKPKCIANWYSVNIGYEDRQLEPIPLGLASEFSKKNLTSDFFENKINVFDYKKEKINLYINFASNTNFQERGGLYKKFKDKKWVTVKRPDTELVNYQKDLIKNSFVLCPLGNGVDTHRIWETLYSGSIPVTKKHINFSFAKDLPILFVDSYDEINFTLLNDYMNNLKIEDLDLNLLNLDFWIKKIFNESSKSYDSIIINEKKLTSSFFLYKKKIYDFVKSKIVKKFITFYWKVKNFIN